MIRPVTLLLAWIAFQVFSARAEVLIVADEFPAMEVLADRLRDKTRTESRVVDQERMPKSLQQFSAVVVYIHRELAPAAEQAFIQYAQAGGRLVLLHHSISSGKRKNKDWFQFLGVELPEGPVEQGGYKWIENVTVQWINLAPDQFIMTNEIRYPEAVTEDASRGGLAHPAFTLKETEVYLNHRLHGTRTLLMGLRYSDAKTGKLWRQDTAGWVRAAGKGLVVYFMPGHTKHDFENPIYGQMVVSAIVAPAEKIASAR